MRSKYHISTFSPLCAFESLERSGGKVILLFVEDREILSKHQAQLNSQQTVDPANLIENCK